MDPQVITVTLPRLIASKDAVERLFEDVPRDLAQVLLVVSAREVQMMTPAVAWELVRQASSRKAMRLHYVHFTPEWTICLFQGAEKLGVLNPAFFLREGEP